MTEKKEAPEKEDKKGVEDDNNNAPDVEALQASNKDLSDKVEKLTKQYDAQNNSHQAELRKLKEASEAPKEDTERIATLELRLARSEAVAEHGLESEDVAMFKGTPDDIKEQAAHFAAKLTAKSEGKVDDTKNDDDDSDDDDHNDPPEKKKPVPKKKGEPTTLEKYQKASANERKKMMDEAMAGKIDLAK